MVSRKPPNPPIAIHAEKSLTLRFPLANYLPKYTNFRRKQERKSLSSSYFRDRFGLCSHKQFHFAFQYRLLALIYNQAQVEKPFSAYISKTIRDIINKDTLKQRKAFTMADTQSSYSIAAATRLNFISTSSDTTEVQTQARPVNDGCENDQVDENTRLPLSSCNDTTSSSSQREQASEDEPEVVLPATSTTTSRKALFVFRPVHKYLDLVCIALSVVAYLFETTMNAALAIFGIGVGVGLVLGDSCRAALPLLPAVQQQQQHHQQQQGMGMPNTTMGTPEVPRSVPNLLPAQ